MKLQIIVSCPPSKNNIHPMLLSNWTILLPYFTPNDISLIWDFPTLNWFGFDVFTFHSLYGSVNVYFMVGILLNLIETTVMKPNKNKTEKNLILTQWSQPDLSKNKTKIKHHFVKITSLFSKNKTHFSRTNTHIFLLFLHKIPFTYTVSIPLIKVYNFWICFTHVK